MKDKKFMARFLTLTLSFVMVFTSLGISVFAAGEEETAAEDQTAVESVVDEAAEEAEETAAAEEEAVEAEEEEAVEEVAGDAVTQEAATATTTTTTLAKPQNVRFTKVPNQKHANGEGERKKYLNSSNVVTLDWNAVEGAEYYNVICNNGKTVKSHLTTSKLTFKAYSGKHKYRVVAYKGKVHASSKWVKLQKIKILTKIHKTWDWTAKMDSKTPLYKKSSGSASYKNLKKGTKGIIIKTSPKRPSKWNKPNRVYIQLLDSKGNLTSTKGWVKYSAISASPNIDTSYDYTREKKEKFANKYSSDTNYLIWVNGYTQRINIFKGKKGSWKLISSNRVTLANYYQPVSTGTKILRAKKGTVTMLDDKGRPYYFKYARTFKGSGYFHTRSYWSSSGAAKNKVQYRPNTKGCIRQYTDDAKFLYSLPYGTKILFM